MKRDAVTIFVGENGKTLINPTSGFQKENAFLKESNVDAKFNRILDRKPK